MRNIKDILRDMSDDQLIELVNEINSNPIAEDSPLRKVCIEAWGKDTDNVMYMISILPNHLLYVMSERFVACSPHVTIELKLKN